MAGGRIPGPVGSDSSPSMQGRQYPRPGPIGVELRIPVLELIAANHGDIFSRDSRGLTVAEEQLARPIFGKSLDYGAVRFVIASIANAPTTLGNHIRVTRTQSVNGLPSDTLIHELTHVWQFQTRGTKYVSNSLTHQVGAMIAHGGDRNFAYHLTGAEVVRAGVIDRLSAEKQAVLVELWFGNRQLAFPDSPVPILVRDNKTCQAMMRQVQLARPLAKSEILEEALYGAFPPGSRGPFDNTEHLPTVPIFRIEF